MGVGVTTVMVAVEFAEVSVNTIMKAAMSKGMSQFVFTVYSNALAIFFLLFSSLIYYRKRTLPPLTASVICRILVLALLSCCLQMFLNAGIAYSSPALCAAMVDLAPAFTFLIAIVSRMERLDFNSHASYAKSIGTIVSIAGALTITLYKGPPITSLPSLNTSPNQFLLSLPSNWIVGGIFSASAAFILSILYIVQTWIIRYYPAELMVTLIACILVTMLSAVVSVIAERDPNSWRLKSKMEWMAIGFSAFFAVTIRSVIHIWACRKKGPVYASMFKPLGMVFASFLGVCFLGDSLYIGSVIGAIVIGSGFYAVMWGKAQDEKKMADDERNSSFESSVKAPLLQDVGNSRVSEGICV